MSKPYMVTVQDNTDLQYVLSDWLGAVEDDDTMPSGIRTRMEGLLSRLCAPLPSTSPTPIPAGGLATAAKSCGRDHAHDSHTWDFRVPGEPVAWFRCSGDPLPDPRLKEIPTRADIGRIYLHGDLRVVLINDREVSSATPDDHDYEVAVKPVDPAPGPGGDQFPVALVDYRHLIPTNERIEVTR